MTPSMIVRVAAVVVAVAFFLPWIGVEGGFDGNTETLSGWGFATDDDADEVSSAEVYLVILAAIGAGALTFARPNALFNSSSLQVIVIALGMFGMYVFWDNYSDIRRIFDAFDAGEALSLKIGGWLTLLGFPVIIIGGFLGLIGWEPGTASEAPSATPPAT